MNENNPDHEIEFKKKATKIATIITLCLQINESEPRPTCAALVAILSEHISVQDDVEGALEGIMNAIREAVKLNLEKIQEEKK